MDRHWVRIDEEVGYILVGKGDLAYELPLNVNLVTGTLIRGNYDISALLVII